MFDAAYTFVYSVLSVYIFYRYHRHANEDYKDLTWVHIKWGLFFLALVLMVIHNAHRVSSEVNISMLLKFDDSMKNYNLLYVVL